ncbi:MAG: hypothetical protein KBD24_02305 [Candidatus Pacebacteria bacterium]|nr:hypothetical protein [Candidatus Paceibacterota bacterium]
MSGDEYVAWFIALLLVPPFALFFTSRMRIKRRSKKMQELAREFGMSFSGEYDPKQYEFGTPDMMHVLDGVLGRSHVIVCDFRAWQVSLSTIESFIEIVTPFPMSLVKRKTLVVVDGTGMFLRAGRMGYPSTERVKEFLRLVRSQSNYEHLVKRRKQAQQCADIVSDTQ